ncbi:hypothetical protein LTR84_009787 [Exophiala bonariae]|uniref:Oxidoreductase-like domain-containing protein n=1 Tax=Exophiala bonariae TaxID=1690606 RepID=A0AAV9NK95_9EURO|nr:hypothetical protein LTR84_009787 [Exophiala bonariae]
MSKLLQVTWVCNSCARQQFRTQTEKISTSLSRRYAQKDKNDASNNLQSGSREQRRTFHHSPAILNSPPDRSQEQALPLGDFYTDLLATPIPKPAHPTVPLPTFVQSGDQSKEERARRLFGTMERYRSSVSESPDATWRTINGVPIPPRPEEPDNCCMSGCVHCVWDDYRDDVESWANRLHEAQAKAPTKNTIGDSAKIELPRPEVSQASGSMDDDGGGSEGLWASPSPSMAAAGSTDGDELFQSIPVGIREFMATEKRIRDRKKSRKGKES